MFPSVLNGLWVRDYDEIEVIKRGNRLLITYSCDARDVNEDGNYHVLMPRHTSCYITPQYITKHNIRHHHLHISAVYQI